MAIVNVNLSNKTADDTVKYKVKITGDAVDVNSEMLASELSALAVKYDTPLRVIDSNKLLNCQFVNIESTLTSENVQYVNTVKFKLQKLFADLCTNH